MIEEFKIGQKVSVTGYQDGALFNGEIGRVVVSHSQCYKTNGYDYAIDFMEKNGASTYLHTCVLHGKIYAPTSNGFWFRISDVTITPVNDTKDTFDEDGEE